MTDVAVVLVAAGRGTRFGGEIPKPYLPLAGRAVLRHTVRKFLGHDRVDAIQVVIDPKHRDLYDSAVMGCAGLLEPVAGGDSRQESVFNGLLAFESRAPNLVLIHDAARPLVTQNEISACIAVLGDHPAALVAVPVRDTLKRAATSESATPPVAGTVSRDGLWRAQTPQGFDFRTILACHRQARGAGHAHRYTDDAAVAEAHDIPVRLVAGSDDNLKITTSEDLARAEAMMNGVETRIGKGLDAHRFGPGDAVTIGGVEIPHTAALVGHSDADVGLHAITDAILGAIGAGDIGGIFSDQDARWAGADSALFLRHARDLAVEAGGRVVNVDLTVICQAPRLAKHREAMQARIAEILDIPATAVNVKATTTERLGFTGREEGIAAEAVASVAMPTVPCD